jgi:CheY-like chemotaxis protein
LLKPVRQSELHNVIAQAIAGDLTRKYPSPEPHSSEVNQTTLTGRVLLAEDNPVNQEVASAMLQRIGVSMSIANNGQEALDLLALERFDLVLMDCQMPIMDGFEATAGIRRREAEQGLSAIPIIALTANAISGDREHCLAQGMDDYLSKPFAQQQLYDVLARWLPPIDSSSTAVISADVIEDAIEIDQQVILQLRSLREDLLEKVISLFRAGSPALIVRLQEAVASGDSDLLYKTAHNFKNSAANLGLIALAAACRDCEALARTGAKSEAAKYLPGIIRLYHLSLGALAGLEQQERVK